MDASALLRTRRALTAQPWWPRVEPFAVASGVAITYFIGATVGLELAFANRNVTAIWPPTGIAVAALLIFGPRIWIGIAVGALCANVANGAPFDTAAAIAVGNTLAPLLAVWLLGRLGMRRSLDRLRDVLLLVLVGGLTAMTVSATWGTLALIATGQVMGSGTASVWLVWWIGDALGVVIFAPLFLTLASSSAREPLRERSREALLLFTTAAVVAILVFGTHVRLAHLLYPFAVWAALRFYQGGASLLTLLVATIAILQTIAGNGPFADMSENTNLISLQIFNAAIGLTSMTLATVMRERLRAQQALHRASRELEDRVAQRTVELATSETRMREAQALAHIGAWHWDVESDVVTWTDEMYRIYGVQPGSFAATRDGYFERVHPDHLEQVRGAVVHALKAGGSYEHEYRIVRPNGEVRWVHARGEVVFDPDAKRVVALQGFCHDITARRESEDKLRLAFEGEREATRRLRALDEMKNSLLAAVSHELRTPLTVILGVATTLQRPDIELAENDQRDLLARLAANAQRLDKLLMDLLNLDRLNRGVIEPRPRVTAISEVADRIVAALEIATHPVIVGAENALAFVDPAQLERIIENLIANATKHTPSGTPIWVRAKEQPEGILIAIEDAGPGVPSDMSTAIFEPFRQGNTPSHAPGTGIGLSLVARFARLNGGRAWVEDRPGGGASFRVLLPSAHGSFLEPSSGAASGAA
jgi:PAS domain S-box-containing protein